MEIVDGTVIAMHGPLVRVQVGDDTLVVAARRRLNWEGGTPSAARLVVGDGVAVEMQGEDGVIVAVHVRRNSLLRKAPTKNRAQILAANVDQALLVFAALEPEPKPGLLDRFLVACHLAGIEAVITINKIDQGLEEVNRWLPVYEELGYRVLRVSARTGWGLGVVKRLLVDRTTLFCGPSGAGKSSLLNAVYPGFRLKVGSLSESTGKGRHTTSMAELMPLPYGGFVVDTTRRGSRSSESGRFRPRSSKRRFLRLRAERRNAGSPTALTSTNRNARFVRRLSQARSPADG
jgi:ribosome biogenesis GTPase